MIRYLITLLSLPFLAFANAAQAAPDLQPYQPDGWSAPIVIAKTNDTFVDSTNLTTADDLWFSYAVANFGDTDTPTAIQIWLYYDGVQTLKFGSNTPVSAGHYTSYEHYNLGKFPAGTHKLKIVADATNAASESDETNNEYTKTITVNKVAGPNLAPAVPAGWSDALVISKQPLTNVDSPRLKTTDRLDIDIAYQNNGTTAVPGGTPGFNIDIFIDNVIKKTLTRTTALDAGAVVKLENVLASSVGNLAPGFHTLAMQLDNNTARTETDENDNYYDRFFFVKATPDLNADYKADILLQNIKTGVVKGLLMGANGAVSGTVLPFGSTAAANLKVVGMADMNGDGVADIIRQNTANGAVTVSYLSSSGVASSSTPTTLFSGVALGAFKVVAILDLDGDGNDDLLLENPMNHQVKGLTLDAEGALVATVRPYGTNALKGLRIAGGADVNGDGRADLLRQDTAGANAGVITASILTGNGKIMKTVQLLGGVAPGTMKLVGTTDLNADGIEDLILEDPANGSLGGEIMDGTGKSVSTIPVSGGPYGNFKVKG